MPTVTFKTVTQVSFTLELDEKQTIGDVKKQIETERGDDFAVELQKLIYNGKILADDATVESAGIDSNKFVVVMLSRKKVVEPATLAAAAPAAATPAAPAASTPAPAPVSAAPTAPVAAAPNAEDAPLTAEQQAMVDTVAAMGYPRDQVTGALRIALWNPDRAVDLLLNGDPDIDAVMGMQEEGEGEEVDDADALQMLANLPQLEELRALVRSNPAVLPTLMQQISQSNPELMQAIAQNQDAFLRLMRSGPGQGGEGGAGAGGAAGEDGRQVIRLTETEAAAVQRIKSMGFRVSDGLIIEAYLACDKNEEMAIDYILNRMTEEDV